MDEGCSSENNKDLWISVHSESLLILLLNSDPRKFPPPNKKCNATVTVVKALCYNPEGRVFDSR
jgi:hypothetical protein